MVAMRARKREKRSAAAARYPPAPDGLTLYLIGDIHGRLDLLRAVQRQVDEDRASVRSQRTLEIYLGDYIDRGPDSAGVISQLIGRAQQVEAVFLRGNHEQLLLDFLHGVDCLGEWLAVGATATMLSYGVAPDVLSRTLAVETVRGHLSAVLPPEHRRFLEETATYARVGAYLAVHAGLRPGISLEDQDASDLLGIRREFLEHTGDFGCIVVHGHTPAIAPELHPNRINIDTGAFATSRLTCLRIAADGARILPSASRVGRK
jgi:serine/threonine protein phosphatase 1